MRAWWVVLAACGSSGSSTKKPDAGPPPFTVYLSFDGETISPASGDDDAATNMSSIITMQKTVPAYLSGVANRDTTIASIVSETQARFAPFNVEVVTTRPTALDYFMIVYTGTPDVVFGSGANGVSAVTADPCMQTPAKPANPNSIAFMFQSAATSDTYGPVERGNLSIPVVALTQNIAPTSQNGDCMCFAAASCGLPATECRIGGPGTPVDVAHACSGATSTEDEMSLLVGVFGAAP